MARTKSKELNIRAILDTMRDGQWAGLDYVTEVKLRGGKKNPMLGRVQKVVSGARVFVGASYAKMVERRRIEEGGAKGDGEEFEVKARAWGTRVADYPIIEHEKDGVIKHYLDVIFDERQKAEVSYLLDGKPIAKEDIEGLPPVPVSEDGQAGIERKVIIRSIGLASVTELRASGQVLKGPFTFY